VNVCIALYKGNGQLHNAIVRRWTNSEYSHAELIMPDESAITILPFSLAGITRRPFDIEGGEKEWDFICIPINPSQLCTLERFYDQTKGNQYDWLGMIASQVVPFHIKHKKRWYCSEWIAYALRLICVIDGLHQQCDMSPKVLSRLIKHIKRIKYSERPKMSNWNETKINHFGPRYVNEN